MKKRSLIFFLLVIATLTLLLSGCGGEGQNLEGKNIVTFELSGGRLETKTSQVDTKINFAYYPDTYILDPAEIPGYKLSRAGYIFTGWYKTSECLEADKWDFDSMLFSVETLTLYAGWKEAISHTYNVYYVKDGSEVSLGTYEVSAGDKFEDWRNFAKGRTGYTPVGYYQDATMETPWDDSFTHPGGDEDLAVSVYVDYIEGTWKLVDTYDELRSALMTGENVYLTADIDCAGASLTINSTYKGIFEGNGYTVSNATVEKTGNLLKPGCAIFTELSEGAQIRNVSFTNMAYTLTGISEIATEVKVAALAKTASGNVIITNVSVTGTLTTDYTGELTKLESAAYECNEIKTGDTVTITDFVADITVGSN